KVIAGRGNGGAHQIAVIENRLNGCRQKVEKANVLMRIVARFKQIAPLAVRQRPIDMFTRAVEAWIRLLVEQGDQVVASGNRFENFHNQLIVVGSNVSELK